MLFRSEFIEEQLSGACTTEIAAFDEFTELLTDDARLRDYAHIVFDTAPTGTTIRLLQLPGAWSGFLDAGKGDASCLGPLAGLDAALAAHPPGVRCIVTCPCDSPFLPLDLVGRLLAAAEAENAELAMPVAEGQFQPVFLLARSDVAESLAAYLAADGRKIDRWVRSRPHVIVDFEDCVEAFANINTAEELARHHGAAAVPRRR